MQRARRDYNRTRRLYRQVFGTDEGYQLQWDDLWPINQAYFARQNGRKYYRNCLSERSIPVSVKL